MTVLLITNRQDYTADFVVLELRRRKVEYVRLNTEDIPVRVKMSWLSATPLNSYIDVLGKRLSLSAITAIWYRRPVPPVPSSDLVDLPERQFAIRESQAAFIGALRSIDCQWISHPDALHAASFKIVQLQYARQLGFEVPSTLVTNVPNIAQEFLIDLDGNSIYKTLAMGRIQLPDGQGIIFTNRVGTESGAFLRTVEYAPCQFQEFVPKAYDVRVTVIGNRVFAVAIHSQRSIGAQIDWRRGASGELPHEIIDLPEDIESKCEALVSMFGLKFGAIDLVLTPDDRFLFLEINGNGQWAWLEQLTGLPLAATLVETLTQSKAEQE